MRIAILFDNFGPYHHARLAAAASVCDLLAVEFGSRSGEYEWAAKSSQTQRHEVINPAGPGAELNAKKFRERLDRILTDFNPSVVVVPGWSNRGSFMAMAWALKHQIPIVLMSESTAWDEARMGWKEWIKQRIVGLASAALVGGQPHADYMRQLGMAEQQVFLGYDAVDNDYFVTEAEIWREEACQLSVVGCRKFFLSSNRFIEKKNLFRLLDAYARYCASDQWSESSDQKGSNEEALERIPWDLCMLGDGELKPRLLAHCAALGLNVSESAPWESSLTPDSCALTTASSFPSPDSYSLTAGTVYFPGFRQIDELPHFYAHAGAFVHASTTEQWGLVVNEAMASCLPVVVSNRVGCAMELVQEGVNGFTFDPYNVSELEVLLARISSVGFPLAAFGYASREIISEWGPERFASGMKCAFNQAIEIGPKRAGLIDRLILKALAIR